MAELPIYSSPTRDAIFAAYEQQAESGFRAHLGASIIGKNCERALWYDFHWTTKAKHPGRVLRLFETGEREEERMVRNLRSIGVTVLEVDPETGRQFQVQEHAGHFGGSMDGVGLGIPEAPKTWHVLEFKTHNRKSFRDLSGKGVRESKPQHYAQMQVYMHLTGLDRALYLAVCKDDDDLYAERVIHEPHLAKGLLDKAGRIIAAQTPLARISNDPCWYECRLCDHHSLCHGQGAAEVNCRTCLHSTAVQSGWHCDLHDKSLDVDEQRTGCSEHLYLPQLVPGEQIDAGINWVEYRIGDQLWRDTGADKQASEVSP